MGLKCSLLGHSFEPADVERERKEEGSEVVTVTREIERCISCGEERVVSESTEVTAVVDEDEVDMDDPGAGGASGVGGGDGAGGIGSGTGGELADRDPAEEDAEILSEDAPDREPGAWPEEPEETWDPEVIDASDDEDAAAAPDESAGTSAGGGTGDHAGEIIDADEEAVGAGNGSDEIDDVGPEGGPADTGPGSDTDAGGPVEPDEETLSGITVPEGTIVCTECSFSVDADSAYRDGDPCPDCGAWLTSERNR